MRGLLVTASLSILVQACTPPPPGGGLSGYPDGGMPASRHLAVDPHAEVLRAGDPPVVLTATLTGAAGPISWSLSGPGALSDTTGETTRYTAPASVDATTVATVTARADPDLLDVVTLTLVTGSTIDVAGRVVGPTGVGLSGLTVGIGTSTVVTGADGRFSISSVAPPYDLDVVLAGTPIHVGRYQGLTRPDPTLVFLWLFSTGEPNTATIAGTVSGGEPVGTAGEFTTAFFTTTDVRFDFTAIGISARNNPFTLPVSWFGPESITGTVHVLQFQSPRPGDPPTGYAGYGVHAGLTITDGGAVDGADVALAAPGNAPIGGTVIPPEGYTVLSKSLAVEIDGLTAVPLGHVDTTETAFSFTVPDAINATAAVTASAQRAGAGTTYRRASGISPRQTDVSIALPSPAIPTAPANGATGVTAATQFSWTPLEHGVHFVVFGGAASGVDVPAVYVVTAGTNARLPDLPSGSSYHWFVGAFGPFDGVDDFTAGANLFPALGESIQSVSEPRSFLVD